MSAVLDPLRPMVIPAVVEVPVPLGDVVVDASPGRSEKAPGLPVTVDGDREDPNGRGSWRVESLGRSAARSAGFEGVLLRVSPAPGVKPGSGRLPLTIDLSSEAARWGAAWWDRVQVVRLPACAAEMPRTKDCDAVAEPVAGQVVKFWIGLGGR